jgi:tRNA threonylcarbamoyladenosine biosynthesis protein TsaE
MEKHLASLEELQEEAARFARGLTPKDAGATLITLTGELGAGKTSFVQGIARALGVRDAVTSPTFVLEKIYSLPEGAFKRLAHIDAYRLKGGNDLKALGYDEIMTDAETLVCLEWPELVGVTSADHALTLAVADAGRTLIYAS